MGKEVLLKVTNTFKWHVEGEIIDENPNYETVDNEYYRKITTIQHSSTQEKVNRIINSWNEQTTDDSVDEYS